MASRNLEDMVPELHEKWNRLVVACAAIDLAIFPTNVARLAKEQLAYWMQGRKPLAEVNAYRKLAGLAPITCEENRRKVTWTLHSKHVIDLDDENPHNDKSRAVDFAILDGKHVSWDLKADVNHDNQRDYEQVARLAEKLGLKSGRKWGDYPHLEV